MAVIELVINPVAGKGRALRIGEEAAALLKSRGIDFAKHLTDHPRHATELARESAGRGAETVIAFGGGRHAHRNGRRPPAHAYGAGRSPRGHRQRFYQNHRHAT